MFEWGKSSRRIWPKLGKDRHVSTAPLEFCPHSCLRVLAADPTIASEVAGVNPPCSTRYLCSLSFTIRQRGWAPTREYILLQQIWISVLQYILLKYSIYCSSSFTDDSESEKSACNAGYPGSIPRSGRSPGEGNGYPFQYSCLENSMDRGARRATVHGIAKNRTWLNN